MMKAFGDGPKYNVETSTETRVVEEELRIDDDSQVSEDADDLEMVQVFAYFLSFSYPLTIFGLSYRKNLLRLSC